MAKGKKLPTSIEGMVRSRVPHLQRYKAFINNNWQEVRMADVIIVKKHTNGNISFAACLIDLSLLGMKNGFYDFNVPDYVLDKLLKDAKQIRSEPMVEIPYELAHNIVFGAIDFAEEFGFGPCKEWSTVKYFFEEDDDNIPFIDIEFGEEGIPVVFATPENLMLKECAQLDKVVGEGNYIYHLIDEDTEDDEDFDEGAVEEKVELPEEFKTRENFQIDEQAGDWEKLLAIASHIERLKPWYALGATDLIAIRHPVNEQVYYAGFTPDDHKTVNIFILEGNRALYDFQSIFFEDGWKHSSDLLSIPQYLIRFERDYRLVRRDDYLDPRLIPNPSEGKIWATFNRIKPCYVMHLLSPEEVQELLPIWEQILEVVLDAHFSDIYEKITDPEKDEAYFYRSFRKSKGLLKWYNTLIEPGPVHQLIRSVVPLEDIQELSKVPKRKIRLECDWFTVQGRVKENGVEFHPTAVLLVDHNNGLIVGHILLPPVPDYDSMLSKIPGEVIRFLISKKLNPERIYVVHETKKHILDSGLRRAGIITETRPQLPNVNETREGLDDMLLNGMPAFNN